VSASPYVLAKTSWGQDLLGELLHSLSQPLTTLRCALELSLEHSTDTVSEPQPSGVAAALQRTDDVICMVQLMREYVDAGQSGRRVCDSVALAPAIRGVIEELSSIAALRGIRLVLAGTSTATWPLPESRLRLALQYLIASLIEMRRAGTEIELQLGEPSAGALLRCDVKPRLQSDHDTTFAQTEGERIVGPNPTIRRARLAIAGRIFANAGALLVMNEDRSDGFTLYTPPQPGTPLDDSRFA
jgi:signal transduction histidine kinase